MPIRTILLPLRESDMSEHMLESGLTTAIDHGAHIEVFYVHPRGDDMLPFATLGMTEAIKSQIRRGAEDASAAQAQRLQALFEQVRERLGVPLARRGEHPGECGASWREAHGVRSLEVARHGRLADLLLIPRPERANPPPKTFEAMLRDTGRPVLMVPRGASLGRMHGRAVLGWNGSTEAARAVAAARPVLRKADVVTVLVSEKRNRQQPDAQAVVDYLRCHGVAAEAEVVDFGDGHVGERIAHHCERLDASLLVTGSYSRTRFQEMLLGGVTRFLIREAPLPVLLVH